MNFSKIIESHAQYLSMWKVFSGDCAGADLSDLPGLSVCWANSAFPFWNAVFLTECFSDEAYLLQRLKTSAYYMRGATEAGLVYVCEDLLTDRLKEQLLQIAKGASLEFALNVTGMVGDNFSLEGDTHSSKLQLIRVTDEATLQDFADVNSDAYGMELASGRAGLAGSKFWKNTAYAYVGYDNGRAVSSAAAVINDGHIYIALVAVRPDAQCKGFGRTTVRYALQSAYVTTGIRRTTLHATDAGLPVYADLGYKRAAKFIAFKLA